MDELVFLEPKKIGSVPFTTSEVIAEFAGVQHHTITRLIRNHNEDFEEFGKVGFEIQALPHSKTGQSITIYHLNEEQATLLLTYLRNTEKVIAFKKRLVHQFYDMKKELMKNAIAREARKPVRKALTDVIRDCVPDSPHKAMMYKHYTDLAYRTVFGKSAAQIRKERSAPKKANIAEYLTAEETEAVKKAETRISVLVELGMDYEQIKSIALGCAIPAVTGG